MMIASHIRKNKQDNQLRTYLKEMARLRKDDRREQVLSKINDIANRRQQQEANQKLQEKLKDAAMDCEVDTEASRPLMTKDTNENTPDSFLLQSDVCVSPDAQSPSVSDSQCSTNSGRARSLSCHESGRRKSHDSRSCAVQDLKTVRIQDIHSPISNDQRSVNSIVESRFPTLSNFHLSPSYGRERSSTVHEAQPNRWTKPKTVNLNDVKFHRISETKQPSKVGDTKPVWPVSFHLVEEDAVL